MALARHVLGKKRFMPARSPNPPKTRFRKSGQGHNPPNHHQRNHQHRHEISLLVNNALCNCLIATPMFPPKGIVLYFAFTLIIRITRCSANSTGCCCITPSLHSFTPSLFTLAPCSFFLGVNPLPTYTIIGVTYT